MTEKNIQELINEYIALAYEADRVASAAGNSYSGEVSGASGVIQGLLRVAYEVIPEDHHLKTWIPKYIKEQIDDVGQRAVMQKLES
jgi:hypothetical protein